jgi:formylglycine-generating enzyme required for sulfatase activity/predicted Ser/Thr protein kinase
MDSEGRRKIEALYFAALACEPSDRPSLFEHAAPEVRREVEALLAQQDSVLDKPAWESLGAPTKTLLMAGALPARYRIEGRLGAGGMGEVFRARDTRLGRSVAIKTSHARFSDRFEREARAISALNHPHICTLYDAGPNYLVMELVEGETLAARLKREALSLEETLRYGAQIAEALTEAHSHGVVHRDLKPANIMLTRHGVKVLDFGLAKMLSEADITETRAIMGTPAYMAPEQVEGREPSNATDLFALGLVLYEMATGELPFPGASLGHMLSSGSSPALPPPSQRRTGMPNVLNQLVLRLLEKDPAMRPPTTSGVARDLSTLADRAAAPHLRSSLRPAVLILAVMALLMAAAAAFWMFERSEQRHWAREQAIPEIARLAGTQPLAASLLLRKVEGILPGDAEVAKLAQSIRRAVSIDSSPPGAKVEIQDYVSPADWVPVGTTPLRSVQIPSGYLRWRIFKPGMEELVAAPETSGQMQFALTPVGSQPGMVTVPGGGFAEFIDFVGWLQYRLPTFQIDRFEVTNAQYQAFVDQGGYKKPEYWKEKFVKDGGELSWDRAMDLFRDQTGRSGPATWEGGHFPVGQGNYPVSGVSWYEAAAYAAFAGKTLPAVAQWYDAAPPDSVGYRINASNFNRNGPAPVGKYPGVGPYGTYDMSGNVREWCWNSIDTDRIDTDRRLILGGAWGTQTYLAFDPEALPPFDRSPLNGFRCVRNSQPLPAAVVAPLVRTSRDFSKVKPVSDELFQAYRSIYAYEHAPLKANSEGVVEDTADWTKERITIDAGHGNERLPLFLFLPKNVHPPYQTILFFPSARVEFIPDSRNLGDLQFVDYVIKSGRALAYPIYKGTYERKESGGLPGTLGNLSEMVEQSKEVGRTMDYLETRPELDKNKIAYLGVSMGAAYGVIFGALDDRFRTVLLLDGGFFLTPALPAGDQVNFAPRLKKPVLMLNGRYDFSFSPERSQEPMFRMIGTPSAEKRRVVLDTPHDISQQKDELSKEVRAWLDQYLGRVN